VTSAPRPPADISTVSDVSDTSGGAGGAGGAGASRASGRLAGSVRATAAGHRVTTLELFFDLVFVFAFTQVTALVADDLSATGVLRGLALIGLLWWSWCSYAWLGNQARADEGVLRAALVVAMGAMLVVALAIPEAWSDLPGGISAPLALAIALAVVRSQHLMVYAIAARGDLGLLRQLAVTAVPVGAAAVLLIVGALLGGSAQTVVWVLALAVDYSGIYLAGVEGWRLHAPSHFAERHGLIVIVALGESIVAIGVGVGHLPLSWAVVLGSVLGLGMAVALWWLYFDVIALVAERQLHRVQGRERTRLARDSFTYLHFPMVVGILAAALGLKKVFEYVADTSHHTLSDALPVIPAVALAAGPAVYLLALFAFYRRIGGAPKASRAPTLAVAVTLLALAAPATLLPALGALGLVSAALVALVAYEASRDAAIRDAIRHGDRDEGPADRVDQAASVRTARDLATS
jgi:low temperature requirement protein LtrA